MSVVLRHSQKYKNSLNKHPNILAKKLLIQTRIIIKLNAKNEKYR